MPRANITIKTNIEDGMKIAKNLKGEMPEAADDAASIIAQTFVDESERVMRRNGSVVTGQGIRSLNQRSLGRGKAGAFGASYLEDLDSGTKAHWPDTNNTRFIAAARSYGMTRQALAETIAEKGTRPHPWIADASKLVRAKAKDKAEIRFQKSLQESLNQV